MEYWEDEEYEEYDENSGYFTEDEYELLEVYHSRARLIHDLMFDLEEATEESEPIMRNCIRKLNEMSDKEYKELFFI